LSRQLSVAGVTLDLFLDIFNLFNRDNVDWLGNTQFYEIGDSQDATIKGDPSVVRRDGITGDFIRNPQVYSEQRQFRFGVAIQF